MKKFYKMFIFALAFAATMTTALISPLSFRAADAIVFAETAASAVVGATITVKGMPTKAAVHEAVQIPSGSAAAGSVVKAKVTDSTGRVVAQHSTEDDANETFTFTPSVAGNYYIVYEATTNGKLTTTSDKFTLKVVQSTATMEFADNSAFIVPSKVGTADSVVLPIPTVTEKEEVEDLTGKLTVTARHEKGTAVALADVTIDGAAHKVFTPLKDAQNKVVEGNYKIEYKYNANGYVATKTFTVKVEDGYVNPTNLSYTLDSTFPTSAVLGNKLTLPKANVVDKDKNNAAVSVYTVVEAKFGEEAQIVDQKDLSFKPTHKATGTDKYTVTYKMYDIKALDLANANNAGKTLAEIVAAATPVLTGEYTLTNVEDTEKPTVKAAREYAVQEAEGVKSVADADAEELKDADYLSLMPSVVRSGHAGVQIPAVYAYDNYDSYGNLAAKLTRTVKYNGNSYVLENEVRDNEYVTYVQTAANEVAD